MGILKLIKSNFSIDFFEKNSTLSLFWNIYNKTNNQDYISKNQECRKDFEKFIYLVNCIPPYFDLKINESKVPFKYFSVSFRKGFLANLKDYNNVDDYVKNQFSSKGKMKLIKRVKRLETSFNIHYKLYYGDIDKETYQFLFEKSKDMINRRFSQKGTVNSLLENWDFYAETSYSQILEKKASLFVVFDKDKPIGITLNYHHQNIFNGTITSFDIDYSKFGLGIITIYKLIEWCINNDHNLLDMGWGDYPYKYDWANTVHYYECRVYYNKNHFHKKLMAFVIIKLIRLRLYLRKKVIPFFRFKITPIFKRKNNYPIPKQAIKPICEVTEINNLELDNNIIKIDINKEEFAFLRRSIYDFQYMNRLHSIDIDVFQLIEQEDSYIINSENKSQKLTY